jgi:hypothetical protein
MIFETLNPTNCVVGISGIWKFRMLNPGRGSMFIAGRTGSFELRQEFHVYVGREHISLLAE